MSIALDSNGKIPFLFENGIKNPSSRKAASADILAGVPVTIDVNGEYTASADITDQAGLDAIDGILLNDIVFEATAYKTNTAQGVSSITSLGADQFSGTMSIAGAGSFKTTNFNAAIVVGNSVSWDGTEFVVGVAAGSDGCVGECIEKSNGYIRVAVKAHMAV